MGENALGRNDYRLGFDGYTQSSIEGGNIMFAGSKVQVSTRNWSTFGVFVDQPRSIVLEVVRTTSQVCHDVWMGSRNHTYLSRMQKSNRDNTLNASTTVKTHQIPDLVYEVESRTCVELMCALVE